MAPEILDALAWLVITAALLFIAIPLMGRVYYDYHYPLSEPNYGECYLMGILSLVWVLVLGGSLLSFYGHLLGC